MLEDSKRHPKRRDYLKAAGGTIAATGLAGCFWSGWWWLGQDHHQVLGHVQRPITVRQETVENLVSRFEDEHDVNVELNLSGFGQMAGSEWITRFEEGEYPVIFTGDQIVAGRFEEGIHQAVHRLARPTQ